MPFGVLESRNSIGGVSRGGVRAAGLPQRHRDTENNRMLLLETGAVDHAHSERSEESACRRCRMLRIAQHDVRPSPLRSMSDLAKLRTCFSLCLCVSVVVSFEVAK